MNEIQSLILSKTLSGDLSPSLTSKEASIVLASQGVKIKNMKKLDIANKVTDLVGAALVILSSKIEGPDRDIVERQVVNDLVRDFQNLTLEDVSEAFRMGTRGEFKNRPEDVVYLSVANIYGWLKAYKEGMRREAMKKQIEFLNKKEKEVKELSDLEKERLANEFLKDCLKTFEEYRTSKTLYDPVNAVYNALDKAGAIKFTIERKRDIFDKAVEHLKHTEDKVFRKALINMTSEAQTRAKVLAKQMALKIFFDELIEMEMELKDLIEIK